MDYFNKFKEAATKGINALVSSAASVTSESTTDSNVANNRSLLTKQQHSIRSASDRRHDLGTAGNNAQTELLLSFHSVCEVIDGLAELNNASSAEADRQLYESSARDNLKTMISLLRKESDDWFEKYGERPDPEIVDMPCLDTFLQTHVLQALCNRATRDCPRGTLPLILATVASMLRNVKYPLLPHQTIHKPIAHLLSIASRYDSIHGKNYHGSSNSQSHLEWISYKKRIGPV